MKDLRFACRQRLKNPGFTTIAVRSVALGVGANTALFSLVNAVLLRSLAVPNPHALRGVGMLSRDIPGVHPGHPIEFHEPRSAQPQRIGRGVWKVDEQGRWTTHKGPVYHGQASGHHGSRARTRWPASREPGTDIQRIGIHPPPPLSSDGPLRTGADDFPVYWVSFQEAEEFCRRLTARARASGELPAGWEFRLPTEAQWEYACRAGTTTAFAFGESLTRHQANIGKPFNGRPDRTPGAAAVRVGSYPANAWGLHDMHGNAFEWCRDWYHARLPGGIDPDLRETQGLPNRDGTYSRVRRGGAWMDEAPFCRSAFRLRYEPPRRSDHIGFRIVAIDTRGQRTTNH